jgi:hypothetical protein
MGIMEKMVYFEVPNPIAVSDTCSAGNASKATLIAAILLSYAAQRGRSSASSPSERSSGNVTCYYKDGHRSSFAHSLVVALTPVVALTSTQMHALVLILTSLFVIFLRCAWAVLAAKLRHSKSPTRYPTTELPFRLRRSEAERIFCIRKEAQEDRNAGRSQRRRGVSMMAGSFLLYLIISSACISTVQALREVQGKGGGDVRDRAKAGAEGEDQDDAGFFLQAPLATDTPGFAGADTNAGEAGDLTRDPTRDNPDWSAAVPTAAAVGVTEGRGGAFVAPNSTTTVAGLRMTAAITNGLGMTAESEAGTLTGEEDERGEGRIDAEQRYQPPQDQRAGTMPDHEKSGSGGE